MSNAIVSEMQQFGTVWPQCVARAWEDEQFREALKRDPVATLKETYQFVVPAGIDLQVVEGNEQQAAQQANTLRMVIPPMPDMDMREIALVGTESEHSDRRAKFTFSATFC